MDRRLLPRVILACSVLTTWGLAAAVDAAAQKPGPPQGVPPTLRPALQHDRANIPPRALPNPPGQGTPWGPSNPTGPNKSVATAAVMGALDPSGSTASAPVAADGALSAAAGGAGFSAPVRAAMLSLLVDGDAPQTALLGAVLAERNPGGAREAHALAASLEALTEAPERLGEAVSLFNALIDASDAGWLADPPEEVLAVRAVLLALVDAAETAATDPPGDGRHRKAGS